MGFCTCTCFLVSAQISDRLEPEIRECADIDVVDFGVAAHFLVSPDEFSTVLFGELSAARLIYIGTGSDFVPDIFVSLRVLPRNRARTYNSDSHCFLRLGAAESGASGLQMGEIASISAPFHEPMPVTADKYFDSERAECSGFHGKRQVRAGGIRTVCHLNVIRFVPAHHLVARVTPYVTACMIGH